MRYKVNSLEEQAEQLDQQAAALRAEAADAVRAAEAECQRLRAEALTQTIASDQLAEAMALARQCLAEGKVAGVVAVVQQLQQEALRAEHLVSGPAPGTPVPPEVRAAMGASAAAGAAPPLARVAADTPRRRSEKKEPTTGLRPRWPAAPTLLPHFGPRNSREASGPQRQRRSHRCRRWPAIGPRMARALALPFGTAPPNGHPRAPGPSGELGPTPRPGQNLWLTGCPTPGFGLLAAPGARVGPCPVGGEGSPDGRPDQDSARSLGSVGAGHSGHGSRRGPKTRGERCRTVAGPRCVGGPCGDGRHGPVGRVSVLRDVRLRLARVLRIVLLSDLFSACMRVRWGAGGRLWGGGLA